jgi:hypothetical protein
MTDRSLGAVSLWFGVVLLSVALNPGVLAASPHLDPPGAGDEQVILEYLLSHYAERPYIGVYESTEGLSLGEWRAVHRFSDAFYTRAVTESLRSEIGVVEGWWMAPLRHYSVTVAAVGVMGPYFDVPSDVEAQDFGVDLDDVEASDLVVHHTPGRLWFAVRDEDVIPLGDNTAEVIGGPHSLRELQDILFARYEPLRQGARESGEWVLGGGASSGRPDESESTRDVPATGRDVSGGSWAGLTWPALVGSAGLLLGLAALLVAGKRLPRHKSGAG